MPTHVVVTCSKRKRRTGAKPLLLSDVPGETVGERATAWIERLAVNSVPTVEARHLYLGEQWTLLRELEQNPPPGLDLCYWVLSAGYGLVPFNAHLRPYSATFSRNHIDSVFADTAATSYQTVIEDWWRALSEWSGPTEAPRSLVQLAEDDPSSSVLISASPVYLGALRPDLLALTGSLNDPERLMVFSGGSRPNKHPGIPLLDFGSRMTGLIGGSLMSLNTRVLVKTLREVDELDRRTVQQKLNAWSRKAPKAVRPLRHPMSDEEVLAYISRELDEDPEARWTPLLRKLRKVHNRACEQWRFRKHYNELALGLGLQDSDGLEKTPADEDKEDRTP
jgi:hypothetical protein